MEYSSSECHLNSGTAITTELLKYLLRVKLLAFHVNSREKPTHYKTQPLLSGIDSFETSQEKPGEQPWVKKSDMESHKRHVALALNVDGNKYCRLAEDSK